MTLLVFGAAGQVGAALCRALTDGEASQALHGPVRCLDRSAVDLADGAAVERALETHRPRLILNAAAYTAVDQAEADAERAHAVNAEAPARMAVWAAANGARLLHYSTDYVFDGTLGRPYREDDACAPLGVYGRSKRAGEEAVLDSGAEHLILRTSWVYATHGRNFLHTMLRLARERDTLTVVDDQWGSPTWAGDLARLSLVALAQLEAADDWHRRGGLYHLSATEHTTWCRFARALLALAGEAGLIPAVPEVRPIETRDWPTPAARPAWSVLDNVRFETAFATTVPSWTAQLEGCMAELASATMAPPSTHPASSATSHD